MSARIVFLGMAGPLSTAPLLWLFEHGYAPSVIAVPSHLMGAPRGRSELPLERPLTTCEQIAEQYDVPVLAVSREWMSRIAEQSADLLLCACWPWRVPADVLQAFGPHAYNLHPSLLPRFRGPAPLFWQLRAGASDTGITLHRMAVAWDQGPVVGQRAMPIYDQDTEQRLSAALGQQSRELLGDYLPSLLEPDLHVEAQDEALASYFSAPSDADFRVSTDWSAQRAYRFVHGTAARNHPYTIKVGARHFRVRDAVGYRSQSAQRAPVEQHADILRVRFGSGVVDLLPA